MCAPQESARPITECRKSVLLDATPNAKDEKLNLRLRSFLVATLQQEDDKFAQLP